MILYSTIAALNTYTMRQIIEVATVYSNKKNANGMTSPVKSYTDLANRIHGQPGRIAVIIFMFIVQLSCCVGYLYFIA